MLVTSKRVLALACSAAACAGGSASIAQAAGPGTGKGLVQVPFTCESLDGSLAYNLTFALAAAARAPGPGALTAPFPGALIRQSGPTQLPFGEWSILGTSQQTTPPFTLADFTLIGQRTGLQSNQLACPGDPSAGIPTLLIAATAGLS